MFIAGFCSVDSVSYNKKDDGNRGIWYMNQPMESVYKYKAGPWNILRKTQALLQSVVVSLGRYYGGTTKDSNRKLIYMVSYYEHKKKMDPRPTILLDMKTDEAPDNPGISVDDSGFIRIFSTSHGTSRPLYIHKKPYKTICNACPPYFVLRDARLDGEHSDPAPDFINRSC